MTVKPSQGQTLAYDPETALGTATGTYNEIRYTGDITHPTDTRVGVANPNRGHAHPANFEDDAIYIEQYRPDALTFSTYIRRSSAANTDPPLALFFQSGGCNLSRNTVSVVSSYVDDSNFDIETGKASVGDIVLIKLEEASHVLDELYYPSLIVALSVGATDTIDLGMELPANTANAEPVEVMTTITPISSVVGATETLTFRHQMRATKDTAEDLTYDLNGCALSGVGQMAFRRGEPPTLELTFHLAKVAEKGNNDGGITFTAETFTDSEKFAVVDENFRLDISDDHSGSPINLTRNNNIFKEATVDWGFKCVPVDGTGDGAIAGLQGYVLQMDGPAKITVTTSFDPQWTESALEATGSQPEYYIEMCQPTDVLAKPAFAFIAPRCIIDPETRPVTDYTSDSYILTTATFICTSAELASASLPAQVGASPWFFGISGAST
jgi:hypothetical protein